MTIIVVTIQILILLLFPVKILSQGNSQLIYIHASHNLVVKQKYSEYLCILSLVTKVPITSAMSNLSFLQFQCASTVRKSSPPKNAPFKSTQPSSVACSFQPKAEEMKWVFDKFDTNKDGKISLDEFKAAARTMGWGLGDDEAVNSFQVMDSDGDCFIDFKEFMEMFKGEERVKETEIKSAFQVFDLNGDGKISADELSQVLKSLGESCSLNACKKMVKGVDGNGDGFVDLNEFMRMMSSGKKLA